MALLAGRGALWRGMRSPVARAAGVTTYLHNSLCFVSDTLAGLRATDTTVDLPVTLHLGRSEGTVQRGLEHSLKWHK